MLFGGRRRFRCRLLLLLGLLGRRGGAGLDVFDSYVRRFLENRDAGFDLDRVSVGGLLPLAGRRVDD